jgi:hypothetical protein
MSLLGDTAHPNHNMSHQYNQALGVGHHTSNVMTGVRSSFLFNIIEFICCGGYVMCPTTFPRILFPVGFGFEWTIENIFL